MRGAWWRGGVGAIVLALAVAGCGGSGPDAKFEHSDEPYLYVWAGDADRKQNDFLVVINADPGSRKYGKVVRTIPVGSAGNEPQELNSELRSDRRVFATGVLTNRTFVFDMGDPEKGGLIHVDQPKGGRTLGTPLGVATIPGGRAVVACADRLGFQGDPREVLGAPGGLLVLGNDGRFVGEKPGAGAAARAFIVAPSGVAVRQSMQMVVTASEGHGFAATNQGEFMPGIAMQVWSLPDLGLKKTVVLDAGPRGEENLGPVTPRFFRDRPFLFVNTHQGGALYVSDSLHIPQPVFRLVQDFGAKSLPGGAAITPDDRFYVTALAGKNQVVSLDVQDPFHPKTVSALRFDRAPGDAESGGGKARRGGPGGLAMTLDGTRVAVADYTIDVPAYQLDGDHRVYVLRLDRTTGQLRFDMAFKDENTGEVGVDFNRETWPHGKSGPARPHGLLFADSGPPERE